MVEPGNEAIVMYLISNEVYTIIIIIHNLPHLWCCLVYTLMT